jgi:cyclopropane fatty-acyl-phospholipid synthase-like methyltransferase
MTSAEENKALKPGFVRDTYDELLRELPETYTEYRWERTAISRFQFRQSARALKCALRVMPGRFDRALEIGGGDGAWTRFFAPMVSTIDFVDISEEMIREAKKALAAFSQIKYIAADFLQWSGEPKHYDLLISIRNLEYMPDKHAALTRLSALAAESAHLVLVTKNPDFDRHYYGGKVFHSGQVPLPELLTLLESCGFVVRRVYPALVGKKTKYVLMRVMWDCLHRILLLLPRPLPFLSFLTESFLVIAQKHDR